MSIKETIDCILEKDPAARSPLEVILCYPGFHAVVIHRLAHWCWVNRLRTLGRFVSHMGRVLTGIEIHPGASIGRRLFIDHGMGVVIGETTVIGDDVVLYQGVTLGAGAEARMGARSRDKKRHPSLGNGVVVGSGAEIQGNVVVGDNVRVASGSIVMKDVPANSVVVGVPGRVIFRDGEKVNNEVPDIEALAIKSLKERLSRLEAQLAELKHKLFAGDSSVPESGETICSPDIGKDVAFELKQTDPQDDPVQIFLHGAGI